MARIRSVKPELCESETMARLSAELERTFVRLWTHCDDEGRCKDDPRLIVAALFPLHDDVTAEVIDGHLNGLSDAGLIVRYAVGGRRFLAVRSWHEHQRPQKPRPSTLPGPEQADDQGKQEESRSDTRHVRDAYGPVVVVGEVEVEVGVVVDPSPDECESGLVLVPAPGARPEVERAAYSDAFEAFWQRCPRKVGKGAAAKAFAKATRKRSAASITEAMEAHAAAWSRWPASDGQFIPHPSTWLNEGRYDDPPPTVRQISGPRTKADRNLDAIAESVARMTGGAS